MSALLVEAVVSKWKLQPLGDGDIPYRAAVYSLDTPSPDVHLHRVLSTEWVFCKRSSDVPAVFSYAGIFSDYETGNLVMDDSKGALSTEADNLVKFASYRSNYLYAFDTQADPNFYDLQKVRILQCVNSEHGGVCDHHGWLQRQSGGEGFGNSSFWIKVPMFLRVESGERKPPCPSHLHEWMRKVERRSRHYRANPARPTVLALEGGRLKNISTCTSRAGLLTDKAAPAASGRARGWPCPVARSKFERSSKVRIV
ncbi:hypothetical protein C8Q76DRAFT_606721 [Earliella scabrosa]|nr:hypothetical protein C8Q76DRAFT_606721 [Earliella scabrosa]